MNAVTFISDLQSLVSTDNVSILQPVSTLYQKPISGFNHIYSARHRF
nr:MAG TPA: hypothetical protein [Bacteriophage sp.]